MFTGIVTELGRLIKIEKTVDGIVLTIESKAMANHLNVGDSISVDGVCLTTVGCKKKNFQLEVTPETLRLTNIGIRKEGDTVNLELAARFGDFLGGHLVQGHVDGTGILTKVCEEGNSKILRIKASKRILCYCTLKGSITLNGVSLTISALGKEWFEVTIIPHTQEMTNLCHYKISDLVNIEIDMISKYVELHIKKLLVGFLMVFLTSIGGVQAASFDVIANTILVYENQSRGTTSEIVIRVARYQPDILMEWETFQDQGTVQLLTSAVEKAKSYTLRGLFKVGVDMVSTDEMTIWLSRSQYDQLVRKKTKKVFLGSRYQKIKFSRREKINISVNKEINSCPVIVLEDSRGGEWCFIEDRENPILAQYSTQMYKTKLSRVVNPKKSALRWIKKLAPIR